MSGNNGKFTLTEILIVILLILVIVAIYALVVMPKILANNYRTPTNVCINNLRAIDGAKQQWAIEHNRRNTDTPVASDLQPYLSGPAGEMPSCPNDPKHSFDTSYFPNNVASKPVCRIIPTNHILP
jgi:competence protein ComGC